jgi:hypothetical protein
MKVEIYEHLFIINRAFEEILAALAGLRQHPAFHRGELERFAALSKEARASTNSYLTGIIEVAETSAAGRRFRQRRRQEEREEQT